MASRGRTTFQKRQRENARKEKQQMKAERRKQKKLNPGIADSEVSWDSITPPELEESEPESEPQTV